MAVNDGAYSDAFVPSWWGRISSVPVSNSSGVEYCDVFGQISPRHRRENPSVLAGKQRLMWIL
jgi:hypothetical protein